MKKSKFLFSAVALFAAILFSAGISYSQMNTFPGTGKSGVGPVTAGGPQDLFHIHGWLPNSTSPYNLYKDAALRISLEDPNATTSPIYGLLAMQSTDEFGAGLAPRVFSSLAKKYDFVLTTTETYENAFFSGSTNLKPYTYDLILSTKNRFASMRFATTPQSATLGTIADVERMTILNNGNIGIGQNSPTQLCEIRNGNLFLSNSGTPTQLQFKGNGVGISTFQAGTQGGSNINYTLPLSAPSANSLLFSSGGSTNNLTWSNTGTSGQILTINSGIPSWQNPSTLNGSFVQYDISAAQNVSITRTNNLFNVAYNDVLANDANAAGAVITSLGGATNRNANGLAITATATGTGLSKGLDVNVGGSTTANGNTAALFNGGNVAIGNTTPTFSTNFSANPTTASTPVKSPFQVGTISIQPMDYSDHGTWAAISYNNWWDHNDGTGKPRRLETGPVSGIGFEPWHSGTNDGTTHGIGKDGSVYLFSYPNGNVSDYFNSGGSLTLRPDKLFLDMLSAAHINTSDPTNYTELFDYQFPTTTVSGSTVTVNNDGHLFIKDQVLIGRMTELASGIRPPFSQPLDQGGKPYMLVVNGSILGKELIIDARAASWADFVFDPSYKLPTLNQVERDIKAQHHLNGIPSASEVEKNGVSVGDMQSKLLQKIEELTLYVIELKKENELISNRIKMIEMSK